MYVQNALTSYQFLLPKGSDEGNSGPLFWPVPGTAGGEGGFLMVCPYSASAEIRIPGMEMQNSLQKMPAFPGSFTPDIPCLPARNLMRITGRPLHIVNLFIAFV